MRSRMIPLVLAGFVATIAVPQSMTIAVGSDMFASAPALLTPAPGEGVIETGDNVTATGEPGEQIPSCGGGDIQLNSVWYSWTAGSDGMATFDTVGSDFDTYLSVHTGPTVDTLTEVVCNDDAFGTQSAVTFGALFGERYLIRIDGYQAATGNYVVNFEHDSDVPINDDLASAVILGGPSGSISYWNFGSTAEPGELPPACHPTDPQLNSVWHQWTAPTIGTATFNTLGSRFDTVLSVYTGTTIGSLVEIACNDDTGTPQSEVDFLTVPGETYRVRVDGFDMSMGSYFLNWQLVATPPLNDDFATALALTGSAGQVLGSNTAATGEPGEQLPTCAPTDSQINSVWFTWSAPVSGTVTFDTIGSTFDTVLSVHNGPAIGSLAEIACNDDFHGLLSEVMFHASEAQILSIRLDGYNAAVGDYVLNYSLVPDPPPECGGLPVTVDIALGQLPTSGDDVIVGTDFGPDVIDGLDGNDTICGLGGDDTMIGGDGRDTIFGGVGIDTIDGGRGNDVIYGGDDGDDIFGGGGGDRLYGELGDDLVRGSIGNDIIEGGPGADELRGQNGDDTIYANTAADSSTADPDTMYGGGLYDNVYGDAGPDLIYGGNFADILAGRGGDDHIYGNNGADTLRGGAHIVGDYCNGGVLNSGAGDTATACETIVNVP